MGVQATGAMDFSGLAALRARSSQDDPEVLREVARQFESLFTTMMLRNMRAASFGDPLLGGSEQETYRDMFDQQVAVEMSRGRGLGIADLLVRQLSGTLNQASTAGTTARASGLRGAESTVPPAGEAPSAFAERVLPHARRAAASLGVDPRVIVAQAALETGWGRSAPRRADGQSSHNLFGIKADSRWTGATASAETLEFEAGTFSRRRAQFRAYESEADAMTDYVRFLKANPRYGKALASAGEPAAFAHALQAAGYATDPRYAEKLLAVMDSDAIRDLDPDLKLSAAQPIKADDALAANNPPEAREAARG